MNEQVVWQESFQAGQMEEGAGYNTTLILDETGNYIAQIGRVYPAEHEAMPMKGTDLDRGSLTLTVDNLEPNTTYTFSAQARTTTASDTLWVGAFDLESKLYDIPDEVHVEVSSTEWMAVTVELTTGPRTREIAFFGLLASNTGPAYMKGIQVSKGKKQAEKMMTKRKADGPQAGEFPVTIPAVQEFKANKEQAGWTAVDRGRVIIAEEDDVLRADAERFLAELNKVRDQREYSIVYDKAENAQAGDIVLTLENIDLDLHKAVIDESYEMTINQAITIKANHAKGIFYGTRTILQALRITETLPAGMVRDWPVDRFRGLQVDTARRYFSVAWLKEKIRELAWMKMNVLHIRLKDAQGLRMESEVAPELVVPEHYTKQEIKELVAYAKAYHVTIIPEIDTPGHSGLDVRVYPEFGLRKQDGTLGDVLDYTKPAVQKYVRDLVHEVCDSFEAEYIHLGGDEYEHSPEDAPHLETWAKLQLGADATWYDGYRLFFNELAQTLKDKIVRPWIWNDMFLPGQGVLELDPYFIIDYWAKWDQSPLANVFHEAGYDTVNKNSDWMYYDLWPNQIGGDDPRRFPQNIYEVWESSAYMKKAAWGKPVTRPLDDHTIYLESPEHHLGALFAIWDDAHGWPSEKWVSKGMRSRFSAYATKVWGATNHLDTYEAFDPYIQVLAVPEEEK